MAVSISTSVMSFGRSLLACACLATLVAPAADAVDLELIDRLIDEGYNHSEVPDTAAYLTDVIGPRLTNSPSARAAEKWTQRRFADWGLKNVRAEAVPFGRGWSIEDFHVRMTAPRVVRHHAIPIAWTPGTDGVLSAPIVVAPMAREPDFEPWRGKLRGKIVLISRPDQGAEITEPMFHRLGQDELAKLDVYKQPPTPDPKLLRERLRDRIFESTRDAFLAAEGAVAWVRQSTSDGGLISGVGYGFGERAARLPGFEITAENYRQLARLAKTTNVPVLEVRSVVRFHDEDPNAYNILADIPGRDAAAGYVMAGAHLDSWVAGDGAADNAAGCVVVMEAARILSKLSVRPKRGIRFALWAAEEQGLLGSLAYMERYLARRPPLAGDSRLAGVMPHLTWNQRWPITPGPDYGALGAYFNLDNGSGKVRGIHAEGHVAMIPLLQQWLAPFASMGATMVAATPTYGTDHMPMSAVGLAAFQFIQDPLDYATRVSHTNIDTYDHLKIPDLKQAAVVLAAMLLQAADHPQALPRKPMPVRPTAVDPFSYDDLDQEE